MENAAPLELLSAEIEKERRDSCLASLEFIFSELVSGV